MGDDNTGAYNNDNQNIQINRTPSRGYNKDSAMDLLVARNEVNRQTQQFLDQIKNMTTEINGILKSIEDSNNKGSKSLEKSATLFLARMKEAQKTGEISTKNQLDFMKDYAKILSKAAETTITTKGVTDEQIKNANRLLKMSDEYIQKAREFNEALENSVDNMATRLSKGLGSIRKDFQDLANTLNIDKLVNGSSIANKVDIMNQTKQNFGLTTNREFESFKNDLVGQMQNLNSQFGQSLLGSDDLKNYLMNASTIGINQTNVAQEQLEALLIGNKYLGQSVETQASLYKLSRRFNDADLTNKMNKTIVGLLNSQLGVSKQQLDQITKANTDLSEDLYDLGYNPQQIEDFLLENETIAASIESKLGAGTGAQYTQIIRQLLSNKVGDLPAPVRGLASELQNAFESGASAEDIYKMFANSSALSSYGSNLSGISGVGKSYLSEDVGMKGTGIYGMFAQINSNYDEINSAIKEGTASVEDAMGNENSVTDYVKNTTVASFEERFKNFVGLFFDKVPWNGFITLGNAAFTLFVAQKGLEGIGGLIDFFKGGGFKGLLNGFLGNGSVIGRGATNIASTGAGGKALGMLGTGATVVGLTAAAIAGIVKGADAITKAHYEASESNLEDNLAKQKGTAFEGDEGYARATGYINDVGTASSSNFGDKASSYFSLGNFAKNFLGSAANGLTGWMNNFNKGNPSKYNSELWNNFMRVGNGLYTEDSLRALMYTYAMALNEVGSFSVAKSLFGFDANSVANWLNNEATGEAINSAIDQLKKNNVYPIGNDKKKWNGSIDLYKWYDESSKSYTGANIGGAGDGLGANMGGGSPVPSGYPWTGTAGYPTYPSGKKHTGIDFGISQGTPVGAAVSGTVAQVNDSGSKGYGRHVIVQGDNGKWFVYGHLSQPKVSKGQHVEAGNLIGLSGNTGNSTGPHLHFEARNNSRYGSDISPYPYLTNGLFSPNGQASGSLVQGNNVTADSEDYSKTQQAQQSSIRYSTRFVSSRFNKSLNMGGPTLDVKEDPLEATMSKKFDELISVITSLSERQDSDSMILQALSNSTRRPVEFGGGR